MACPLETLFEATRMSTACPFFSEAEAKKIQVTLVSSRPFRSPGCLVVRALMDPVTEIAFRFLPSLVADYQSSMLLRLYIRRVYINALVIGWPFDTGHRDDILKILVFRIIEDQRGNMSDLVQIFFKIPSSLASQWDTVTV